MIYILTLISLILFLTCSVILACTFNQVQRDLIDADAEYSLLYATYSRLQKSLCISAAIFWGFTLVHATIVAAVWVKELM